MDEELLLKIKNAELQAKKIIEDAEKRKQEMLKQAETESAKLEEREATEYQKQLAAEAKKQEKRIEEEREVLLAEGLKGQENARKSGEKNIPKALDYVTKNFDIILKGKKNVLS